MDFEAFLKESISHHEAKAQEFKAEAAKHKDGTEPFFKAMAQHHWHKHQAAKKAGRTAEAAEHAHKSYGYSRTD